MSEKSRGQVKWFSNEKGYGFIIPDDLSESGGKDIMVHYRSIMTGDDYKKLDEGQIVEYICVKSEKGFQAQEVTPVP